MRTDWSDRSDDPASAVRALHVVRRVLKRVIGLLFPLTLSVGCVHAVTGTQRTAAIAGIARTSTPLMQSDEDYEPLMRLIGDSRFVLLGESTHGTEEFYRERARVTQQLIAEKGFTIVAVETDWADAFDVNEYIQGAVPTAPGDALQTFERFPTWTWNNRIVTELVGWLRAWNASHSAARVGFYGIDLYNVPESARRVVAYLEIADPPAAAIARNRYSCFGRLGVNDLPEYGHRVLAGERKACAEGAAAEFLDMARRMAASGEHRPGDEALVAAWQNARVVMNGEAYYRLANLPTVESWNLRDRHMADTIDALALHLESAAAPPTKVVVWAHSSHLGDARRTERSGLGELNVGQLLRQRHDGDAVLVGFTTYDGTVRAARSWGGRSSVFPLKAARTDSFAGLFHEVQRPAFFINLRDSPRRVRIAQRAHSSDLGDARRTERAGMGELNVGQLLRQRHDGDAVLVGFRAPQPAVV